MFIPLTLILELTTELGLLSLDGEVVDDDDDEVPMMFSMEKPVLCDDVDDEDGGDTLDVVAPRGPGGRPPLPTLFAAKAARVALGAELTGIAGRAPGRLRLIGWKAVRARSPGGRRCTGGGRGDM